MYEDVVRRVRVYFAMNYKLPEVLREKVNLRITLIDSAIALLLTGLGLLNLWIGWQVYQPVAFSIAIVLTSLAIIPLAFMRRFPLAVLITITVVILVYRQLDIPEGTFTLYSSLLALFSAGAFGNRKWWTIVRAVSLGTITANLVYLTFLGEQISYTSTAILSQILAILYHLFLFGAAWWIGDIFRARREREDELKQRTIELEYEREENARRAVIEERVRIARELHDVVAHHVSVIGVQAGAARRVLEKQPDKARESMSVIEKSSREAVSEMQRLLGLLRQDDGSAQLAPQPGLDQLTSLVEEIKIAGLPVELVIEGERRPLSPGVDLSTYRIIQEALTNTLKHAGPAEARVVLKYANGFIELEVSDNGKGVVGETGSKGRGLIGMKERVNLHGGKFEAYNLPERGFVVRAKLPLNEVST
jgi:signal transduction histidine kinase